MIFQGRVRVLALLVKLFSISSSVASVIFSRNLLALLEDEIRKSGDTLVTLSALELWYEVNRTCNILSSISLQYFGQWV